MRYIWKHMTHLRPISDTRHSRQTDQDTSLERQETLLVMHYKNVSDLQKRLAKVLDQRSH